MPDVQFAGRIWATKWPNDQATTDAYTDVWGSEFYDDNLTYVAYTIHNVGPNGLYWRVLTSIDTGSWAVIGEAFVPAGGVDYFQSVAYHSNYKVQIKAATAGAQTTARVRGKGKM